MTDPDSARRALRHPAFVAALLMLVVNDHVLKGAGLLPGAVTGKLSDLAWIILPHSCSPPSSPSSFHVHPWRAVVYAVAYPSLALLDLAYNLNEPPPRRHHGCLRPPY